MSIKQGFCKNCGATITNDMKFCKRCGAKIETKNNIVKIIGKKLKNKAFIITIASVVLVVILSLVITGLAIYNSAQNALKDSKYQEAYDKFSSILFFKDSKKQANKAVYESYVTSAMKEAVSGYEGVDRNKESLVNALFDKSNKTVYLFIRNDKKDNDLYMFKEYKPVFISEYYYENGYDDDNYRLYVDEDSIKSKYTDYIDQNLDYSVRVTSINELASSDTVELDSDSVKRINKNFKDNNLSSKIVKKK